MHIIDMRIMRWKRSDMLYSPWFMNWQRNTTVPTKTCGNPKSLKSDYVNTSLTVGRAGRRGFTIECLSNVTLVVLCFRLSVQIFGMNYRDPNRSACYKAVFIIVAPDHVSLVVYSDRIFGRLGSSELEGASGSLFPRSVTEWASFNGNAGSCWFLLLIDAF